MNNQGQRLASPFGAETPFKVAGMMAVSAFFHYQRNEQHKAYEGEENNNMTDLWSKRIKPIFGFLPELKISKAH